MKKAAELAAAAADELGVVSAVYNYVCGSITYDREKAANVKSGYDFVEWEETHNTNPEIVDYEVTGNKTFTAIVDRTPGYTRDVVAGNNIGTLCVDHNVPEGGIEGAIIYELQGKNDQGKLVFDEVTSMEAGHPYVFQSPTGQIKLYYGSTSVSAPIPVNGMVGSFEDPQTIVEITEANKFNTLYIADNKLWYCDNLVGVGLILPKNRCYIFNYAGINAAPNHAPARRRVVLGTNGTNVATDIDEVYGGETSGSNVRKVLIDNTLYIIRGEKMYNVEGQMVR